MAVTNGASARPTTLDLDKPLALKSTNPRAFSPTDAGARSSFSVRENDGLAQTFTRSRVSSYEASDDVFDDNASAAEPRRHCFQAPLTQPHSRLHGFWCPPDNFKGWKEITIKGKLASRSCEYLHRLRMTWDDKVASPPKKQRGRYPIASSPLETLPIEVLTPIIDLLVVEIPPSGLARRNVDLMALLLTSRTIHATTLNTLYRHITIPHSRIFRKFLTTITAYPALATIVRRLDFNHFNPSMLFSTASERAKAQNLTVETLGQCLGLMPYLHEFLAQEYLDNELGADVLRTLLFRLPLLQALDLCGCSSTPFKNAFISLLGDPWPDMLSIARLSLHRCISLPPTIYETILPRLHHLTHLDVAGTRMTDRALASIPPTARLTHLNLAKCKELSPGAVIKFLSTHPAVIHTLTFLSLATDLANIYLLGRDDLDALLPILPPTLKSLSLRGSRMHASHVPHLRRLVQSLEELALGRGLDLNDVHGIFKQHDDFLPHTLRYLDISEIDTIIGSASALLASASAPLSVIEVEERAHDRAAKLNKSLATVGWMTSDFGSRYWLVRKPPPAAAAPENPRRWWKMGAESWGMRKIPVAEAEVGGMYGSFMFGRRL